MAGVTPVSTRFTWAAPGWDPTGTGVEAAVPGGAMRRPAAVAAGGVDGDLDAAVTGTAPVSRGLWTTPPCASTVAPGTGSLWGPVTTPGAWWTATLGAPPAGTDRTVATGQLSTSKST